MSNKTHSVPEYYLTADGREFGYVFDNEIGELIVDRVSAPIYHCLASAAEHRFRCGYKFGQEVHDVIAETYWLDRARQIAIDCDEHVNIEWCIKIVVAMVDHERRLKIARDDS